MQMFESPPPSTPSLGWMLIFADLLSLILTFFVMVFSMNAVQVDDWQAVVNALSDRLNPAQSRLRDEKWDEHPKPQSDFPESQNIEYLNTVIEEMLARDPVLQKAHVRLLDDRVAVSLPADLLFSAGSSEIADPKTFASLAELAALLGNVRNEISVVGYTDPSPVHGKTFASPWELSLARAMAIARVLRRSGYRQPMPVYGYGGKRYGDLLDGLPMAIQSQLSRRVDIVIRDYEQGR
ncbi:MAG: chemotaxis protein MotB [Proteobacteria bacterium]|nr:MAG: chemotaxis protein MotB [Pseudomonadota bacterium]